MCKSPAVKLLPRLLCILRDLKSGQRLTREQVAERFKIDVSTAGKYFQWIRDAEPINFETKDAERVWFYDAPLPGIEGHPDTLAATIAVNLARSCMGFLGGSRLDNALERLSDQLQGALTDAELAQASRVVNSIGHLRARRALKAEAGDTLNAVLNALIEQKGLRFHYRKGDGKETSYDVDPLRLLIHNGRLALWAVKHEGTAQPERTFVLDRMEGSAPVLRKVRRLGAKGDPWGHAFGLFASKTPGGAQQVRFTVRGPMAEVLRHEEVHPSERREENADGSITLSIKVFICPELRTFLKSLIPHLEIHEPASLRQELAAEVRGWLDDVLAFTLAASRQGAA